MNQHVFYSYDSTMTHAWVYSSFPVAAIGAADSLPAARAEYEEGYAAAVEDIPGAPPVSVEHLEQRHPTGVWVRVRVGDDLTERYQVAMALSGMMTRHPEDARYVEQWSSPHTDLPTVIACLPGDTIGTVADEIDEGEAFAVALAFPDVEHRRDLVWVSGLARGAVLRDDVATLERVGLGSNSTMLDFMRAAGVTPQSLAAGSGVETAPMLVA